MTVWKDKTSLIRDENACWAKGLAIRQEEVLQGGVLHSSCAQTAERSLDDGKGPTVERMTQAFNSMAGLGEAFDRAPQVQKRSLPGPSKNRITVSISFATAHCLDN